MYKGRVEPGRWTSSPDWIEVTGLCRSPPCLPSLPSWWPLLSKSLFNSRCRSSFHVDNSLLTQLDKCLNHHTAVQVNIQSFISSIVLSSIFFFVVPCILIFMSSYHCPPSVQAYFQSSCFGGWNLECVWNRKWCCHHSDCVGGRGCGITLSPLSKFSLLVRSCSSLGCKRPLSSTQHCQAHH